MQRALGSFSAKLERDHGLRVAMRVGINTGLVLAGRIGGEGNKAFTVMGDTVNTASRFEHSAPVGGILCGEETWRQARRAIRFETLEPIHVKGKEEALKVFRALAERTDAELSDVPADAPFFGRDGLLAFLNDELEATRRSKRARELLLAGEAGCGKSRLLDVFLHRVAAADSAEILAVPLGLKSGLPLRPLARAALRSGWLDPGPGAPEAGDEAAVEDAELGRWLAEGDLSGRLEEVEARWRRSLGAVARMLCRVARHSGALVLALDDVGVLGQQVAQPFQGLIGALRDAPVLILETSRSSFGDEELTAIAGPAQRVDFGPIVEHALAELVRHRIGPVEALPEAAVEVFVQRSQGLPGFAEALVDVALAGGFVRAEADGVRRLAPDWQAEAALPASLRTLVQARIDTLTATERRVLQLAAVVGEPVLGGLVRFVLREASPDAVDAAFEGLRRRRLVSPLRETPMPGEPAFVFESGLVADVAEGLVLHRDRKPWLDKALAWLEERRASEFPLLAAPLARILEGAGRALDAAEMHARAAQEAEARVAPRDAISHLEHAIKLRASTEGAPDTAERSLRLQLALELARLLDATGQARRALDAVREALASTGDAELPLDLRVEAARAHASALAGSGLHAEAVAAVAEAVVRFSPSGAGLAGLEEVRGRALRFLGRFTDARAAFEHALAAVGPDSPQAAPALRHLATVCQRLGEFDLAEAHLEASDRLARRAGDEAALARNALARGNLNNLRGHTDEALGFYAKARSLGERAFDLQCVLMAENNAGEVYAREKRYPEARESLLRALGLARLLGVKAQVGDTHRVLADVHTALGELDEAAAELEKAESLAASQGEDARRAEIRAALGRLELRRFDDDGDEAHVERALEHLVHARDHMEAARVQSSLARLCLDAAEALAALAPRAPKARLGGLDFATRAVNLFGALGVEESRTRANDIVASLS